MDALERILRDEEGIEPSAGFTHAVMDAVRAEAAAPAPIGFPWRRALPGFAVCGVALLIVLGIGIAELVRVASLAAPATASASQPIPPAFAWVVLVLSGTYLLLRRALTLAELPR